MRGGVHALLDGWHLRNNLLEPASPSWGRRGWIGQNPIQPSLRMGQTFFLSQWRRWPILCRALVLATVVIAVLGVPKKVVGTVDGQAWSGPCLITIQGTPLQDRWRVSLSGIVPLSPQDGYSDTNERQEHSWDWGRDSTGYNCELWVPCQLLASNLDSKVDLVNHISRSHSQSSPRSRSRYNPTRNALMVVGMTRCLLVLYLGVTISPSRLSRLKTSRVVKWLMLFLLTELDTRIERQ